MASPPPTKLYGHAHRLHELEPHYSAHVSAMTTEKLHGKSDIAAELAWRDARIAALELQLDRAKGIYREDGHIWESDGGGGEFCSRCHATSDAFSHHKGECPGKVVTPEKPTVQP